MKHFSDCGKTLRVGDIIEFTQDVDHGDFKTASAHPKLWPTIEKGTKCKVVGFLSNFYGSFVRVNHNGQRYDIEMRHVK